MEWPSLVLSLVAIMSALCILYFSSSKIEVKLLVFIVILCNVGNVLLGNRIVDGFYDVNYREMLNSIKKFQTSASDISTSAQEELSEKSKTELLNKINELNNQITRLGDELSSIDNSNNGYPQTVIGINNSAAVLQQVETIKQLQLSKLNELKTQLAKTQQIVSAQQNAIDTNKYQPIKIYSSCIVSNADGTYST